MLFRSRDCSRSGPRSLLRFVQRTSLPIFQCGSSPVSSIVSRICFQFCLGCCQLVFFSCRYIEIAAYLCLPSPLFLSPQALAWPFLAWWFQAPIIASYVFSSVSLHSESLVCVVQLMYMFGLSHAPFLAKLITSGEFG